MTRYVDALNAMKAAVEAVAPERVVLRKLKDLDAHTAAEMAAGCFMIVPDGVRSYPYETSDAYPGIDTPSQTDLGNFEFAVIGRGLLKENAAGEDIDAAEDAMLAELEAVANAAIGTPILQDLHILRSEFSGQLLAPYYAVYTRWRVGLFN